MSLWPVNFRGGDILCRHRLTKSTTEFVSQTLSWVRLGSRGWSGKDYPRVDNLVSDTICPRPIRWRNPDTFAVVRLFNSNPLINRVLSLLLNKYLHGKPSGLALERRSTTELPRIHSPVLAGSLAYLLTQQKLR